MSSSKNMITFAVWKIVCITIIKRVIKAKKYKTVTFVLYSLSMKYLNCKIIKNLLTIQNFFNNEIITLDYFPCIMDPAMFGHLKMVESLVTCNNNDIQ